MARRTYTDVQKAAALAALDANGGNLSMTSKQMGIAISTLAQWRDSKHINENITEIRNENRAALAERLDDIAHRLVDRMPEKMADATLKELSIALGITMDKLLLLRGESTSNARHEIRIVTDDPDADEFQ